MQNKWAILVGTDYVPGTTLEDHEEIEEAKTFAGCVRDVEQISSYLQRTMAFPENNIYSFISEHPFTLPLPTNPDRLATYANVVHAFHRICTQSTAGDVIYIHFSLGVVATNSVLAMEYHRGRVYEDSFVLLSDDYKRKYLHSLELSVLLNRLGRKGLDLTVVLDKRRMSSQNLRWPFRQSDFSQEELSGMFHGLWCPRDFDTQLNNPDMEFFFVLAIAEFSYQGWNPRTRRVDELQNAESKDYHGYLTSWLLNILQSHGAQITWDDIIRQLDLQTKLHRKNPNVLYDAEIECHGNTERLFLQGVEDRKTLHPLLSLPGRIFADSHGVTLMMQAGSAQGMNEGVKIKFDAVHDSKGSPITIPAVLRNVLFEVTKVTEFTSSAIPSQLSPIEGNIFRREVSIEVDGYVTVVDRQYYGFYPQSEADHVETYKSRLRLLGNSQELLKNVKVQTVGGFRYDNGGNESNVKIPTITPGGFLHLLTGDYAAICLSNPNGHDLYIHVLYFDSAMGITQVSPKTYETSLRTLGVGRVYSNLTIDFRLLLSIPERVRMTSSKAVTYIKIITTNKPTSFHSLELPPIENQGLVVTSNLGSSDILSEDVGPFLQDIFAGRKPESQTESEDVQDEIWACFNLPFVIHSTAESLAESLDAV
ncbi:hypothetical protein N7490_003211 [Penicillium lividum]|nr:hypothetical protein N7490_003211 [Penicillium lividum]